MVRRYLSNRERILLHLSSHSGELNYYNAPYSLTQDGIAEAIGIGRNNVPREIKTLMQNGLVEAHKARVPGLRNRRTVYILTPKGAVEASRIRERIENLEVSVIPSVGKCEKVILKNVSEKFGVDFISAAINLTKDLKLDLVSLVRKRGKRVHEIDENYRISRFYGRREELSFLKNWLRSSKNILVVTGMHGVGKTTLLLKFVEEYLKDRDVLFVKIDEMMSAMDLVHRISKFMSSIGFPKLERYIHFHSRSMEGGIEWRDILTIMNEGMGNEVYIFDNTEDASPEVKKFLKGLLQNLDYGREFKVVVVGGDAPEIVPYNLMGRTEELHVGDLDEESAYAMLIDEGVSEKLAFRIIRKYGGNPLLLALAKSNNPNMVRKYILDGILAGLNEEERRAVEIASVFRKPVKIRALLLNNIEYSTIYSLINRNVFQEMEYEIISLHRVVRSFVYERLTEEKRRKYHLKAAEYTLMEGDTLEAVYHFTQAGKMLRASILLSENYHKHMLENPGKIRKIAEGILSTGEQRVQSWPLEEIIGDTYKIEGEWREALHHYERALEESAPEDLLFRTRISLKMAEIHAKKGEKDKAIQLVQNVLSYEDRISRKEYLAMAYYVLGNVYLSLGNPDDAEAYFTYALRYAEESADYRTLGYIYVGLGNLYKRMEKLDVALDYYSMAYEYMEAVEDKLGMVIALNNIGGVHYEEGKMEGEKPLKKALAMAESIGDKWGMCHAHHRLGILYLNKEKLQMAERHLAEAERIAKQHEFGPLLIYIEIALGDLYAYKGDAEKATGYFEKALHLALKEGNDFAARVVAEEAIRELSKFENLDLREFQEIIKGEQNGEMEKLKNYAL